MPSPILGRLWLMETVWSKPHAEGYSGHNDSAEQPRQCSRQHRVHEYRASHAPRGLA